MSGGIVVATDGGNNIIITTSIPLGVKVIDLSLRDEYWLLKSNLFRLI